MSPDNPSPSSSDRDASIAQQTSHWATQRLTYYAHLFGLRGRGALLLLGVAVIAWVNSGIYIVQPDEEGLVLRFGRWVATTNPGLHYHLPYPVDKVLLPKVTRVNQLQLGRGPAAISGAQEEAQDRQMLTSDENIVEASGAVLWRIKEPSDFLFKIEGAEAALKLTAESALREVIARTPIQSAMSDKRQQIADETRDLLQALLDRQHSGILVTQVQLQRVDPPAAVIDAFNDVQRARADQERERNEAEAYANDILPRGRGAASHIIEEAEAYKSQAVNLAEGDAQSFLAVYASYARAKDVIAWRLYMESVDEMLKKATKVVINMPGKGAAGVIPYLPLSNQDKVSAKETQK